MKAISTQSFNAMGVIAPEAGMIIDTNNEIIFAQLKNMGFIEEVDSKTKRAKKK